MNCYYRNLFRTAIFIVCASIIIGCTSGIPVEIDSLSTPRLPKYWIDQIETIKDQICQVQNNSSNKQDSFYFITDYHIEDNVGYSHRIIEYLQETIHIKNLVFGGDIFNNADEKDTALGYLNEFHNRFSFMNMFGIRGNHDFNVYSGSSPSVMLSNSDLFKILVEPVADEVTIGKDSLYYFRDNRSLNLRYIFLDSEKINDPYKDDQMRWLKDRMTELPNTWSIVIFTHSLFSIKKPKENIHPGYDARGQLLIDALTSIHPDALLVALISGHCHYDYSTNIHGFWEISTTCDSRQECGGLPETLGTTNEQAFDIFTIDLDNKALTATRIGRGNSRKWEY